jgi:hypothetical protein
MQSFRTAVPKDCSSATSCTCRMDQLVPVAQKLDQLSWCQPQHAVTSATDGPVVLLNSRNEAFGSLYARRTTFTRQEQVLVQLLP